MYQPSMKMSLLAPSFSFLLIILSQTLLVSAITNNNNTDFLALLELKSKITDDPFGVMTSWNNSVHLCQWSGVTCGRRHQRVTILDLTSLNLAGSISPSIGNLSFLRNLTLHNNSLTGYIPPQVGRLQRLRTLDLRNNSLVGNIPTTLSTCRSLVSLYLSSNELSREVPEEIGLLRNLQVLSINTNNLVGTIPSSIGNLSSLRSLSLRMNHFSGTIPHALGQLKDLISLDLATNGLGGTIPPSIFNLSSLEQLSLSQNFFHGSLPSELGVFFPNLRYLGIIGNQFTGSIPPSISNASNLQYIFLAVNNLTGDVPSLENLDKLEMFNIAGNQLGSGREGDLRFLSSLINATNLRYLIVTDNRFGGVLPVTISNFSSPVLTTFVLDNNQIVGNIPPGISNLKSLETFSVRGNRLSGTIPEDIGELQNLRVLFFDRNNFTGEVPSSLGNLDKLLLFGLSGNNLHGEIPSSFGKWQNLLELNLSNNHLTGSLPLEVLTISSLSTFDVSRNRLTGVIPLKIGDLKGLSYLNVSQNMFSGEIPSSLGNCLSLETLDLGDNFFQGTIPSSLASLRGLQHLNISHNNLSGAIPTFLESFDLQSLDLSFNNFSGMVPSEGVLKNASVTSVRGNNMLCGGTEELQLPICPFGEEPKKKRLTLKLILIISIVLSFLAASAILASVYFCLSEKKTKEVASDPSMNSILQVSYKTLFEATNGFSSTNLIGTGSFASVYKGVLVSQRHVAVKVFNMQRRGASKSFMVECEALRNIRHRNLVKVITACSSIDSRGDDFKAIVYEFMVNGSLDQWLHPIETSRELNFKQRLDIAIGIASALDYLHNQHGQTPIVHCDLKPSNVLLDEEMTAQVGDFGLMKFLSEGTENLSTNQTSLTGVRGTIGYVAPEYGMGSEVSTYGDMYSFGILLLEMFTGRKPTDAMFDDNMNLRSYVKMASPDQVAEIANAMLQEDDGIIKKDEKVKESLQLIFDVGVACSDETVSERMNICDALAKLTMIKGNTGTY